MYEKPFHPDSLPLDCGPGEAQGKRLSQQVPGGKGTFLLESRQAGLAQHQVWEVRARLGQGLYLRSSPALTLPATPLRSGSQPQDSLCGAHTGGHNRHVRLFGFSEPYENLERLWGQEDRK